MSSAATFWLVSVEQMEAGQERRPRQRRHTLALIEGFVKFEDKGRKGKFISVYAERTPDPQPEAA